MLCERHVQKNYESNYLGHDQFLFQAFRNLSIVKNDCLQNYVNISTNKISIR